jgi:protein-S-isoprenylcysteine O-methyltransferase Ste14
MPGSSSTRATATDALRVAAVISVAVYLIPEGAHFFEMFSKIALPPDAYMTVQRIYDGWAFFGIAIVLALALTLAHAVVTWRTSPARWLSLASFAALAATQVIFWSFIYPMNALTRNWTRAPDDLEAVRRQWEYGHALSAALTLCALWLVLCAVLAGVRAETSATSSAGPGSGIAAPSFSLAIAAVLGAGAFVALAIIGWGGLRPFFSHASLTALTVVTCLLTAASMFTVGNLSPGVREDRANRWVLLVFAILGVLIGWLPAYTDRLDWGTFDGDGVRWVGVALYAVGGVLRLWPVFVLGNRFSGLVAIQPGHSLVTSGLYRRIRHPSYLGMLICIVGWALAFRSAMGLLLALATLVPVIGRVRSEEALLAAEFGQEYQAWCSRTARLLPGVY